MTKPHAYWITGFSLAIAYVAGTVLVAQETGAYALAVAQCIALFLLTVGLLKLV